MLGLQKCEEQQDLPHTDFVVVRCLVDFQLNVGKNIHGMKIERSAFKMKMKNERNGTCVHNIKTEKISVFLHCKKIQVSCRIPVCR